MQCTIDYFDKYPLGRVFVSDGVLLYDVLEQNVNHIHSLDSTGAGFMGTKSMSWHQ